MQSQLRNVRQIQATNFAFAAVLANGSVVAWGKADRGGAFVVTSADGSVVIPGVVQMMVETVPKFKISCSTCI